MFKCMIAQLLMFYCAVCSLTGGGGGEDGKGAGAGGKKHTSVIKTYLSPWEQAMGNDADLKSTMNLHMALPGSATKLHAYKCFNR